MRSTTATRTSTDSAEAMPSAPAHRAAGHHAGALRRHAAGHHRAPGRVRARSSARRSATSPTSRSRAPVSDRDDIERAVARLRGAGTRRAARRHAHLRARRCAWRARSPQTRLPICLANIQPVPGVTAAWDMADLTYNQGIHGAQDTANAMVRAGRPFHVVTDDWHADSFARGGRRLGARGRRGHALARAEGRRLRLRDERHGRHPRRRARAAARARPAGRRARARGAAPRRAGRRATTTSRALIADEDARFEIDPRLQRRRARGPRAHAARARGAAARGRLRRLLDALRRDRRGRPLRAPAARRRLEPDGQGLRLRRRGRRADRGADVGRARRCSATTQFTEMYAMDFPTRLDPDEPHGRGQLGAGARRPPGPADQAPAGHRRPRRPADVPLPVRDRARRRWRRSSSLGGERFRLLVVARARSSTPTSCRRSRCPTGSSAPTRGVRECMDAWLRLGGPHHQVLNPGRQAQAWRTFCELAGLEFAVA